MIISIANDHAGFELKYKIVDILKKLGHIVINNGCDNGDSVDYPDYAHLVGKDIEEGRAERGIVLCGSGNGVNMVVNKYKDVRSALCWTVEIAELARKHNNANVIAIPARFLDESDAIAIVKAFTITEYEGGRHQKRIEKIPK